MARSKNVFAYVFEGGGSFRDASAPRPVATDVVTEGGLLDDDRASYGTDVANRSLTIFDTGDEIRVRAGDEGLRFLLVSGAPIREPIAWRGPVVMNTQEELHAGVRATACGHVPRHPLIDCRDQRRQAAAGAR